MACPFYHDPPLRDSLAVCGSGNRNRDAPSLIHMKLLCLSISAYKECPEYKMKISNRKKSSLMGRFLKAAFKFCLAKKREEELEVPEG